MRLFKFVFAGVLLLTLNGCCVLGMFVKFNESGNAAAPKTEEKAAKPAAVKEMNQQAEALSGVGETTQTSEGIKVNLKGDLSFAKGKADLSPAAVESIAKIADQLKLYPDETVTVTGYTDNSGSQSGNLSLSKRRAQAVKTQLEKDGVDASRITALGKGDQEPVAPNDTDENRAKNRRTELLIHQGK